MTPSKAILETAQEDRSIVDALGRHIIIRNLTALDKLRLLKTAGPELALNQPWLSIAILAASVTAIDDLPIPRPTTEGQIEALVGRLGDAGIDAIAEAVSVTVQGNDVAQAMNAGNLCGTPS
ncbi:MAG TPA: hypothetical protein VMB34_03485 [Acetobacteraceae bacterium]|nr:hypothetical protein [Acetobacteraceae bacterium]